MIQAELSQDINTRILFRAIDLILSWPDPGECEQQPQSAADDGAGDGSEQSNNRVMVSDGADS